VFNYKIKKRRSSAHKVHTPATHILDPKQASEFTSFTLYCIKPSTMRLFSCFLILCVVVCTSCDKETKELAEQPKLSWSELSQFPSSGRQNPVSFVIGSRAYVGLGTQDAATVFNDLWEYDATNDAWTRRAEFPGKPRSAATAFTINDKAYVVNGYCDCVDGVCGCSDFWEYDPVSDGWTRKADFPLTDLYYSSAFVIGGKAYVGTGSYNGTALS
jgi:N-acetylneuraminic acid mutarotase